MSNSVSWNVLRARPRLAKTSWPGNRFAKCILMDAKFGLSSWLLKRGDTDGYLFCNVSGSKTLQLAHHEAWARKQLVAFTQDRFTLLGMGKGNARAHTGHSLKRGGVQLLRFLGVKDSHIMKWFRMTGDGPYLRYSEGFNDLNGKKVPDFSSIEDLVAHAQSREELDKILDKEDLSNIVDWIQPGVSGEAR